MRAMPVEPESESRALSATARRGGTVRILIAFLAVVTAIAGFELYALWSSNERHHTAATPVAPAPPPAATPPSAAAIAEGIVGWIDAPAQESVVGTTFVTSGWALAPKGVRGVEIRVDGAGRDARYGLPRPDVAVAKPGYPDATASGFAFDGDFSELQLARHAIDYVAVDRLGNTQSFGHRSLIPPRALAMWRPLLDVHPTLARQHFDFLMMMSGITLGGAAEVDTQYKSYVSRTQRVGISVPILYLRTTRGAALDWRFDPDFDLTRKCGNRLVAEDNLTSVIAYAVKTAMPVQFILNGGVWADSSCETTQWDLTDHLEEDPANCQWSQSDVVFPDNYLKGLAGSLDSPELARSLTYNIYAAKPRMYKKRNLQAAAAIIAAFAREHPDLFIGVALDSDTYMNPFFLQKEIFDYNPGMLRQFRDWLRGTGAYSGRGGKDLPDLTRYRRKQPLMLAEVNGLAQQHWTTWDEVQPPRRLPGSQRDALESGETPFWNDPWWQTWDAFRKHVIGLHYDELSAWANEAGIPSERIFSAQGFMGPSAGTKPFAIHIFSHGQNYDSAGLSVEGAIPRRGHLGAVIYGDAARNDIPMEERHSLFATFGRMDDGWAIVEYNSTDLKRPNEAPTYASAYRTFRDAFNHGAREISAMAWNGSNGLNVGQPGYQHITAWRNTQPEQAMLDFLVAHADVPWGARLWTFGAPTHRDDDGWVAARGRFEAGSGFATIAPADGTATLLSPPDQVIRPDRIERMIMRWDGPMAPERMTIAAQLEPDGAWQDVGTAQGQDLAFAWPARWRSGGTFVERLKVDLTFPAGTKTATLSRVLLYPRAPTP
jgi:hypothetical protein